MYAVLLLSSNKSGVDAPKVAPGHGPKWPGHGVIPPCSRNRCVRLLAQPVLALRAMSEGLNLVTLFGNLGADPELMHTAGGPLLKMRLATTEVYFDKEKKRQERTEWHTVKMWGRRAEGLSKILGKGSRIFAKGR